MAGTLGSSTHFAVCDRKTFTISVDEPESELMTLAFWDQAEDAAHNVMVIPRAQFDRALQAYLGLAHAV
jgi:hypothetical protein